MASNVFWGPTGEFWYLAVRRRKFIAKMRMVQDVEIWNIVFNEYFWMVRDAKLDKGEAKLKKLDISGIDTGMGLERLLSNCAKNRKMFMRRIYLIMKRQKEERIIADHVKASVFII